MQCVVTQQQYHRLYLAQYDFDHCYMEGITDLGYMGHLWVVFATSSRSSTERYGDFSESVVFHFLTRCPSWFLGFWLWWCWVLLFFVCLVCFLVTPIYPFHLYSHTWELTTILTKGLRTVHVLVVGVGSNTSPSPLFTVLCQGVSALSL